jgi:alcohol dehydrogenase
LKAVIFHAPGRVSVDDVPEPRLEAPTDAIVKVTTTAICEYDVLAFQGKRPRPAGTIGHELVGIIHALGDGVSKLMVGQRVVSPPSIACGGCFYCKQGLLSACERIQFFERQLPGTQTEYVRVPNAEAVLEALPETLSEEKAVLIADLLPGVFAGLTDAGLKAGDSVAVVGCGPKGLAAVLMARASGAGLVFAIDADARRREVATELGAIALLDDHADQALQTATAGRGVDMAIEAEGTANALARAADLVRPWGTLLNFGYGIELETSFPIGRLTARHVRLVPASFTAVKNYMAPVLKMLTAGVIDPAPIISHTLPLAEAPQAYEMLASASDSALKVLLRP